MTDQSVATRWCIRSMARALCLLTAGLTLVGAASDSRAVADPFPGVDARAFCEDLGATWDEARGVCGRSIVNARQITVQLSAEYPEGLLDDRTAGAPLKEFVREFFTRFGHLDDGLVRDGQANLTYQTFEHAPGIRSVVFRIFWYLGGAHPNDEITTFTFDLQRGRQLALADLFCRGIDPLTALSPLVRPYVKCAVTQGIDLAEFDPGHRYNYTDDYRAWYLDGPDLVLAMPAARSGPVPAGQWQPHIPLAELNAILREGNCAV
ncbi:putative secreted protein [Mycolicibacterium fortuitum]|uniref:Putative secreted protein n=1 Tax=Mycolicibacterium fortuitum TaxID=1766 RepID=A0A378UXF2_MYCFO|nr:putative secreted protein [Mycolicibacterium fortuitum]